MSLSRQLSLAHLSMIELPPADLARAAAIAGFDAVGFRLTRTGAGVEHGVLGNDRACARLTSAVAESGIVVLDVEVIRITEPDVTPDHRPLLEAGQALGARYVLTVIDDPDRERAADRLAQVAADAAVHGLSLAVEAMLFSSVKTLADAVRIVRQADAPNLVVLPDLLHLIRAGDRPTDLADCPEGLFAYAQVCDARGSGPAPDAVAARTEAVTDRLPPGEGDLPVREFVAALPAGCALSVECPRPGHGRPTDPAATAGALLAATRRVLPSG